MNGSSESSIFYSSLFKMRRNSRLRNCLNREIPKKRGNTSCFPCPIHLVLPAPKAQTKTWDKKGLHVTALLPQMLRVKSLTINDVTDVTPFLDLCIDLS